MGEISEMVFDGTLCEICGGMVYEGEPTEDNIDEVSPGFPRKCASCEEEE